MKHTLALIVALTLGMAGAASAGMQGQGGSPDAKKPEFKEQNPGDTSGKQKAAPTGAKEKKGAAAHEKAVVKEGKKKK